MNKRFRIRFSFYILALIALVIVVLLNVIMGLLSTKYNLDYDITNGAVYMPDDSTLEEVKKIDKRIEINIISKKDRFSGNSNYNYQADLMINKIAESSKYIDLKYIDYKQDPAYLANLKEDIEVEKVDEGDIIISSDDKSRLIKTYELFNYVGIEEGNPKIVSSKAEEEILQSILYVTSENDYKIGLINSHGETKQLAFQKLIESNGYKIEEVNLAFENIGSDINCLVIVSPKVDYSQREIDYLHNYLVSGGKDKMLLLFTSSEYDGLNNLFSYIEEWGIKIEGGTVFETDDKKVIAYQPFYPMANVVNDEEIKKPLVMPLSRPLTTIYEFDGNYKTKEIAFFSETSGVRPFDAGDDFEAGKASRVGPMPSVVESEHKLTDTTDKANAKVVVFSSSKMIDDVFINTNSLSNGELIIDLLSEQYDIDMPKIIPKTIEEKGLNISQKDANTLGIIFVLVIPFITFGIGLAVFFTRRKA